MSKKFGIDIGSTAIKFAQIEEEKDITRLRHLFYFTSQDDFSTKNALRLKKFLKNKKIKIKEAIAGISEKYLNIHYVSVPTNVEYRVKKIIEMEVKQLSDKMGSILSYDYVLLDLPKNKRTQQWIVAIAVVHDSFLDTLCDFFHNADIKISGFVPNSLALYNGFIKFAKDIPQKNIYIVDIGAATTDLVITSEAALYFLRNINTGLNTVSNLVKDNENGSDGKIENEPTQTVGSLEKYQEQLLNASNAIPHVLEASIKFAKVQIKQANLKIDQVFLTGGASRLKGLKDLVQKQLNCETDFLSLKNLDTSSLAKNEEILFEEENYKFANAIGLAQFSYNKFIPLKITSYKQDQKRNFLQKTIFNYASIAIIAIVLVFSIVSVIIRYFDYKELEQQLKKRYKTIYSKTSRLNYLKKENMDLKNKLKIVHDLAISNKQILEVLSWLRKVIPDQMYMIQIRFDAGIILLKGEVEETNEDVYTVLKQFKNTINTYDKLKIKKEKKLSLNKEDGKLEFELELNIVE